jgi:hypothetical protein
LYSKTESSEIKQAFWTAFGQFMALQPRSDSTRINWVNYKTGVKHLYFKMDVDSKFASIAIEMNHPDLGVQELMFEQFRELQRMLENTLEESWEWQLHTTDANNRTISVIKKQIDQVSVFRKEDWAVLIPFFKQRIMSLHEFWTDAQYAFEVFL